MAANAEAIAWYLKQSEDLLDDHRERILALRSRGGQVAGFSGAVLALAAADANSIFPALHGVGRSLGGAALLIGSLLLVAASVTAVRGTLVPRIVAGISVEEVVNYVTDRFVEEPDLWRVHLRTIHGLVETIEVATRLGDQVARTIGRAERFFLVGLSSVGTSLGILVLAEMF